MSNRPSKKHYSGCCPVEMVIDYPNPVTLPFGNRIEMFSYTPEPEDVIERAGRTCYQSYDKIGARSASKFIKGIIKRGHESVIEHASATFIIVGSRAMTHQLVRHRLASYSQKSQRYVKEDGFEYIIPSDMHWDEGLWEFYKECMSEINDMYLKLREWGLAPEDARFVLPNACKTEIVMTANFREWRHFIKMRCDRHAQWEIRDVAHVILEMLHFVAPSCFQDLYDEFFGEEDEEVTI